MILEVFLVHALQELIMNFADVTEGSIEAELVDTVSLDSGTGFARQIQKRFIDTDTR